MATAVKLKKAVRKSEVRPVKMYRALVVLQIGPGDERMPGDFVPEALAWKNPAPWVSQKKIELFWPTPSEYEDWQENHKLRLEAEQASREAEASQAAQTATPAKDEPVEEDIDVAPKVVIRKKKKVIRRA